jgi:tRNA (guanine-N7-)-methyltransferase
MLDHTDWGQWDRSGHVVNGDHADDGPQSLTNFAADVRALTESGQNSYRFGIEWARWFWRYASDRLRRNGCTNVRTVRAEASYFLTEFVPPASISVLHIYFPDPWPKARHHKRRLMQPKFMPLVHRVLAPGGRIQVVTDHQGYWEENVEPVIRAAEGFKVVDYNRPGSAGDGEFVGTNFERKYVREGRPFYAIAAVKT